MTVIYCNYYTKTGGVVESLWGKGWVSSLYLVPSWREAHTHTVGQPDSPRAISTFEPPPVCFFHVKGLNACIAHATCCSWVLPVRMHRPLYILQLAFVCVHGMHRPRYILQLAFACMHAPPTLHAAAGLCLCVCIWSLIPVGTPRPLLTPGPLLAHPSLY